jgi:hypothetical protein
VAIRTLAQQHRRPGGLIHDLAFTDSNAIRMNTNRGVIYSITANNRKGTEEVVRPGLPSS